jgi:hypothetical protein
VRCGTVSAQVAGTYEFAQGKITLKQTFQKLRHPDKEGKTAKASAVRGKKLSFTPAARNTTASWKANP